MSKKNTHVLERLDDYLHGVLPEPEVEALEQHIEVCRICQVAMEEARERYEAMRSVPTFEASEELIQDTVAKVAHFEDTRQRAKRISLRVVLPTMAASFLLLVAATVYWSMLAPTPYDLQIFGQSEIYSGTPASLRIRLTNRQTGQPLEDVPVKVEIRGGDPDQLVQLASFRTNANGTGKPRFRFPEWPDGEYKLAVVASPGWSSERIVRSVMLKRSWKLMLSTDKPVYQPGQTIHVRSLGLRRPDLRPVAGHDVVFTIADPKGNVIFKQKDVTSKYGIASVDCPLAEEINHGPYTVECVVGQISSKVTVQVKKYVLPKFKVHVELDRPYYQPGQTARGTVRAAYFFGKPVVEGKVDVEVTAIDTGPKRVDALTTRLDTSGKATFNVPLPMRLVGREQDSGDARVWLRVTVTDSAGQKHTNTVSRIVTTRPLRVEVIPESSRLVRGVANTIYVLTSYADGQPARTRVTVTGLADELTTGKLGVASFQTTPESDSVGMTVRAVDDQGLVGRSSVTLICGKDQTDFILRTDKAVYDGGDTMHLVVLGGGNQPVFVDFIKNGQTILTECVAMVNERGEYHFDLPPDVFGTVELRAYHLGYGGLPICRTRAIYVRQAGRLKINTSLARDEYRPGQRAKLAIALTDDQGNPTPGAVSLAAVDEAVFSVLQQRPGMEETFFSLEQEILKPVYAIYPWSPSLTASGPSPDRAELEKAVFSRTSKLAVGREAELQRLVEEGLITPNTLQMLDHPDIDALMSSMPLSEETVRLLKKGAAYPLTATSYPDKTRRAEASRRALAQWLWPLWIAMLVTAATFGLVVLVIVSRVFLAAVLVIFGIVFAVWLCLPSLARARGLSEPALRAAALRSIDQSLLLAAEDSGRSRSVPASEVTKDSARPSPSIRVREWFPETLLWRPELITDDQGRVSIDVDLADSITTWRLTSSAVSADGRLGGGQSSIRVFQPFFVDLNLPVAMTRGDEAAVPVVVYNYLDRSQIIELSLTDAPWFERLEAAEKRIELPPGGVKSVDYRLRVKKVGHHELQVTARGEGVADAVKRRIEVVPSGRRIARAFNGTLERPAEIRFHVPENAVEGSVKGVLKIYPSTFSQLVEGLEGIFRRPFGCFEQTSSTTYPNVLALDYLRATKQSVPVVEAKARQYIHLGYQRLLGFEVDGGGFDWFGRPPAKLTLTAYGLMEFEDMAKVHDVDPRLIERTRRWLLDQRNRDGSWPVQHFRMHVDPTRTGDLAQLSKTAYIAWAVFSGRSDRSLASPTLNYLLRYAPQEIDDAYVLALVCNALLAIGPDERTARPYLDRLELMKRVSPKGDLTWWEQGAGERTAFYGSGRSGSIETTALAALAMIKASHGSGTIRGALSWLITQRDGMGAFHSTQATVLALKALIAGTGSIIGEPRERRIEIALPDGTRRDVTIPADQAEVVKQMDLSEYLSAGGNRLTITERSDTSVGYQVALAYHVPGIPGEGASEPLSITMDYDRTELRVGQTVRATASIVNRTGRAAPMVILDLPIPAGFRPVGGDWAKEVASGRIAKYQITPRSVVVYLRQLEPGRPLTLRYQLTATMPVKTNVAPARAYEYYDPDTEGTSAPMRLVVKRRI